MKTTKKWKDPLEEMRWVKAKLSKEYNKDPEAFRERINKTALEAGFQVSDLKPISLAKLRPKKSAVKKKV